ncbi:MAG TPA: glycerol-3-phosphate ABC transporter ATP-binding protein [Elusimicrobia bacterium]|jgi:multiple sugar transport system ATP-binding protein|nr:glycerol-3-phosphate ABC transporter ATP-binding protein [Elusimicrobiota bacterium]
MKLKLGNLTKKFLSIRGEVVAVNNINLEIEDKEFFVLLGPSGCGKSTLLNLIAGLEKPTSGEIWFAEKLIVSMEKKIFFTPKERNVAMVFQSYALYPHLSVFENIAFPLRIMKTKENMVKEAVKKVTSTLEIFDLLSVKPAELSGGEKQRVAIARAIVRQPEIFLLDEPLSNLDAQLRLSTRAELKNLQRHLGVTTVYVTHDQVEAMALGDRIAVLKDGKVVQVGTPAELYERPANTFVAAFIGSPPMNFIEGSLFEEKGIFYIIIDNLRIKMPDSKVWNLKRLKSKSCIFGIHPEDIYIRREKTVQNFKTRIISVEPLGRDMILHTSFGEHKILILTKETEFKEGDTVNIEFNWQKTHIFEKSENGERIN